MSPCWCSPRCASRRWVRIIRSPRCGWRWRGTTSCSELHLAPLNAAATSALAADLLGHTLAPAQAARLFQDTEGNPLFVVETVRAGMAGRGDKARGREGEPGRRPRCRCPRLSLPPKVRAVIRRRLALLSPGAQALAQTAAVIGREFTFAVLARASGQDEAAVVQSLDELWRRQLVREQGVDAYDFSHDKIRAVAYAEHQPNAPAQRSPARGSGDRGAPRRRSGCRQRPDRSALRQAGRPQPAIAFYRRAAAAAQRIYANAEAVRLYNHLLTAISGGAYCPAETCEVMLALGEVWRVNWPVGPGREHQSGGHGDGRDPGRHRCCRRRLSARWPT